MTALIILLPLALLLILSLAPRRRSSLADRAARDVAEAARETEAMAELMRAERRKGAGEAAPTKVVSIRGERRA